MIEQFKGLQADEIDLLYKATALVSLYVYCLEDEYAEETEEEAKKLAHLRTYTSPPILHNYYKEVEADFSEYFEELKSRLPAGKNEKLEFIGNNLEELRTIISKLDKNFAIDFRNTLNSYAEHVSNSKKNFLASFLIPIEIEGITESSIEIKNL